MEGKSIVRRVIDKLEEFETRHHVDLNSWGDGIEPSSQAAVEALRADLRRRAPLRMARLEADVKWLESQGKRYGLSPEAMRWML